jgi:hypothetical protein
MVVVVVEFSMLKRKNPVASNRNGLPRVWSRHGIADREPMTASAITCIYSSEDLSTRGSHVDNRPQRLRHRSHDHSRLCPQAGEHLFSLAVPFAFLLFFPSSRVSAHVNVPALVGMKLMCLAPSGFGILSRLSGDLRDSQKELSRR